MNRLAHAVHTEAREAIESVKGLRDALEYMCGIDADCALDATYTIELLAEKLSDGSVVHSISIRPAPAL
ncbi:MAG TPA: hypothetical protein VFX37_09780 [Pseudolabrys sp.]|nr:hypothetical protein [Pseudolabrys sp.]